MNTEVIKIKTAEDISEIKKAAEILSRGGLVAIPTETVYGLAANDAEAGWRCLENASDDTMTFICKALRSNGDGDFASAIESIMKQKPVNIRMIRDYLIRNKKYVSNKMFRYVCENIDKF